MRRLAAGVGAVALTLMSVAVLSTPASAETGFPVPSQTGSLTLHKHVKAGDSTPPQGAPLPGVKFEVQQVGVGASGSCVAIDLTTPSGWASVSSAIEGFVASAPDLPSGFCTVGNPYSVVTGADGQTQPLTGLQGLYRVVETDSTTSVISEEAAPFLVTVPMPVKGDGETADSWNYDVHAYPKNVPATTNPTKTVAESNVGGAVVEDSQVPWEIKVPVPVAAFPYNNIVIQDVPSAGHTFVQFTSVTLKGDPLDGPGAATPDYTVSGSTITLTEAGLAKVNALVTGTGAAAAEIKVGLITQVSGDELGVLTNKASVTLNGTTTPTPEPKTVWGKLQVLKHVAGNTGVTLEGAEFDVYVGECPANGAPTGDAVASGKTGSTGVWEQVLWIDNAQADETGPFTKAYCLVETVAPQGYVLDSTPRTITLSSAGTSTTRYEFPNTAVDGPDLPMTGASGTALFTMAGLALVAIAGGGALVRARRNH